MWAVLMILSAMMWGLTYTFMAKMVEKFSPPFIYVFACLPAFLLLTLSWGRIKQDAVAFIHADEKLKMYALIYLLCGTLAALFLYMGMARKNTVLAGLIEISYPLFTALFTYMIFRQNFLNTYSVLGGILVFSGVLLIALKG